MTTYSNVIKIDDLQPRNTQSLHIKDDRTYIYYETNSDVKNSSNLYKSAIAPIWDNSYKLYSFSDCDCPYGSAKESELCQGHNQVNNFVRTYWDCFFNHGSAVFSASDLWLVVTLSFAKYCSMFPEGLKPYINPEYKGEKRILTAKNLTTADWKERIDLMVKTIIEDCYKPEFIAGLQNDLKCATPIERTACNVSIMKAVDYYYQYRFQNYCGFSSIKLIGEKEDWIQLRNKVLALAQYNFDEVEQVTEPTKTEPKPESTETKPESTETKPESTQAVLEPKVETKPEPIGWYKWFMDMVSSTPKLPKDALKNSTGLPEWQNNYINNTINKKMKWSEYINNVVAIIDKFIESFDNPDKDFFRNMMHDSLKYGFYGDSTKAISGWILKLFYGYNETYIVSEVPIIEASVDALYDPEGNDQYFPIQINSGFSGYQKKLSLTDGKTYDYRPVTFCSVSKV